MGEIVTLARRPQRAGRRQRASRWFAVQTQPRKERLALHHLANQDFDAFCPMKPVVRRIGGRNATVIEPFFPAYLFVRLDTARERWRSVNGTIGVVRLVGFGPEPSPLPNGLIERLRALCNDRGELKFDDKLRAGERVRIMGGPLDALCGLLVTAEPSARVTVLLELLSGATQVSLARDCLARV